MVSKFIVSQANYFGGAWAGGNSRETTNRNAKGTTNICDSLSDNPALPANIKFELEAILSVQVVF